jgi:hypothetical protein
MTNPTLPNSRRALARACSAVSISQSCRCRNALFQFAYAEHAQFPQVKVS